MYIWIIIATAVLWGIYGYNKLVKLNQHCLEGWSGIDVQLKRRRDLIPELVKIAAFYAKHEKETFNRVTELRTRAENAENITELSTTETEISGGINTLLAVAEAYPELKSDKQFVKLQENLAGIEKDLSYARRYYNAAVRSYNIAIHMFPELIVADAMGYTDRSFFEINAAEREAPNIKL